MAKLYFKHSPMNAGKSTEALQVADNYERDGHRVVLIKPKIDDRGGDAIVSRLGVSRTVDMWLDANSNIRIELKKLAYEKVACVVVDEAQFLTAEHVLQLRDVVDIDDIPVMAFGLRTDFQRKAFGGSLALFELADVIEERRTVCQCKTKASFNIRLVDGKPVFEGNQVVINNQSTITYKPVCGACYKKALIDSLV